MNEVQRVLTGDAAVVETESFGLGDAELVRLYEAMAAARAVDEESARLHDAGEIAFYIRSSGLEAVSVGAALDLGADDWLFPSHRDVGMYLLRGGSMRSWFDQLFGNAADLTKGRQTPGHHSLPGGRYVSVSGRVGAQLVQAAGCALAAKSRHNDACVLTSFGEETCNSADFHAAMNVAARFRAPAIFVCRSQRQDEGVRLGAEATVAARAESYGMPFVRVEGTDALAVYRAVRAARESAIGGGGPTLVEAVLDAEALFGEGALAEDGASGRDPVARLREFLEQCGAWNGALQEEMSARLRERVGAAVSGARAEPGAPLRSLLTDVYEEPPWMLQEQGELISEGDES